MLRFEGSALQLMIGPFWHTLGTFQQGTRWVPYPPEHDLCKLCSRWASQHKHQVLW